MSSVIAKLFLEIFSSFILACILCWIIDDNELTSNSWSWGAFQVRYLSDRSQQKSL